MRRAVCVHFINHLSEIDKLSQAVTEFGESLRLPDTAIFELNLALEEMFTNVISYGYEDTNVHDILIRLSFQDGEITAEIEDDGRPFNPLEAPVPDVTKPLEERPVGGLGIHLGRKLMDAMEYNRRQNKNRLIMKKRVVAA